jgi:hypothetical protein
MVNARGRSGGPRRCGPCRAMERGRRMEGSGRAANAAPAPIRDEGHLRGPGDGEPGRMGHADRAAHAHQLSRARVRAGGLRGGAPFAAVQSPGVWPGEPPAPCRLTGHWQLATLPNASGSAWRAGTPRTH